jgi:STE24 endopeptidase
VLIFRVICFGRNLRRCIFGVVLVLELSPAAFAAPFGPPPVSAATLQSSSDQTTQPPASEPQVKPYTLPPAKEAQAEAYAHSRHELYFLDLLFSLAGLLLILQLAVAPRLRDFAERLSLNRFGQAIVFSAPLLILFWLLSLPSAAAGHWIERYYGQSVQGWGSWFVDALKGGAIALVIAIILIWLFYGLLRRSPRHWWFYAWLGSLPILVFLVFVEPLVLEPLFFHFTPLAGSDPQLAAQLERVVQHAGQQIPESRMFLMNASSKLNALNAYVTGIGSSERVVVWDTTIKQMSTPEILFVFGHEMGHYVLHHIRDGMFFTAGILIVFFFCEFQVARWVVARFGSAWNIRSVSDWASLPVLVLIALIFSTVITPVDNAYSRHLEHQADQYGLEVVHGIVPDLPQIAAHSFQVLGEIDLSEPSPSEAVKIWFYDHPTLDERIRFAQTYDPWQKGQSPEFVK